MTNATLFCGNLEPTRCDKGNKCARVSQCQVYVLSDRETDTQTDRGRGRGREGVGERAAIKRVPVRQFDERRRTAVAVRETTVEVALRKNKAIRAVVPKIAVPTVQ